MYQKGTAITAPGSYTLTVIVVHGISAKSTIKTIHFTIKEMEQPVPELGPVEEETRAETLP